MLASALTPARIAIRHVVDTLLAASAGDGETNSVAAALRQSATSTMIRRRRHLPVGSTRSRRTRAMGGHEARSRSNRLRYRRGRLGQEPVDSRIQRADDAERYPHARRVVLFLRRRHCLAAVSWRCWRVIFGLEGVTSKNQGRQQIRHPTSTDRHFAPWTDIVVQRIRRHPFRAATRLNTDLPENRSTAAGPLTVLKTDSTHAVRVDTRPPGARRDHRR